MRPINLLVINQFASTPKYSSGAGERFYYLAPFFKKNGINTRVVSGGYNHLFVSNPPTPKLINEEKVKGGIFIWVRLRKYNKGSFIGRFLSWIEFLLKLFFIKHKDRPDIVLVSSMSLFPIIYAFWLRLRFKARVILEVRDIWPLTPIELGGYGPRNPFIRLMSALERWSYRSSDVLVSVLPDFGKHVQNVLGIQKQTHWIPNAISSSSIVSRDRKTATKKRRDFLVIYAGAIGIANAMDRVVEVATLLKDHKDIIFRIVGDGPEKERLMEKAKASGLESVDFTGKIPKNRVSETLATADIAVISWNDSRLYEYGVSANKYNDYMLAGLPIVSFSNIQSDPVVLADCGYQVSSSDIGLFADKILELRKKSPRELAGIGRKGQKFVLENQTYEVISTKYIDIIKRFVH